MNWDDAKEKLDVMSFPDDIKYKEVKSGEHHTHKKERHDLVSYENLENLDILGYRLLAKYNYCPECAKVMNKVMTIFNNENSACYQHIFKLHGKDPNSNKLLEDMATVFTSFALFLFLAH